MTLKTCPNTSSTQILRSKLTVEDVNIHNRNLLVPIDLCRFALRERLVPPLKLFIYLKATCAGQKKLKYGDVAAICRYLKWTPKTYKSNLRKLLSRNWVGYNINSGYHFVRGFNRIAKREGFRSRSAVLFQPKDFNDFRSFIAGAVICGLVSQQRGRKFLEERKAWRSNPTKSDLPSFYPVASKALSTILGISISSARSLKDLAKNGGYIRIQKKLRSTDVPSNQKNSYKKAVPEEAHKVRVRGRWLWLQDIDTVCPLMTLRSKGSGYLPSLICNRKFPIVQNNVKSTTV